MYAANGHAPKLHALTSCTSLHLGECGLLGERESEKENRNQRNACKGPAPLCVSADLRWNSSNLEVQAQFEIFLWPEIQKKI